MSSTHAVQASITLEKDPGRLQDLSSISISVSDRNGVLRFFTVKDLKRTIVSEAKVDAKERRVHLRFPPVVLRARHTERPASTATQKAKLTHVPETRAAGCWCPSRTPARMSRRASRGAGPR